MCWGRGPLLLWKRFESLVFSGLLVFCWAIGFGDERKNYECTNKRNVNYWNIMWFGVVFSDPYSYRFVGLLVFLYIYYRISFCTPCFASVCTLCAHGACILGLAPCPAVELHMFSLHCPLRTTFYMHFVVVHIRTLIYHWSYESETVSRAVAVPWRRWTYPFPFCTTCFVCFFVQAAEISLNKTSQYNRYKIETYAKT